MSILSKIPTPKRRNPSRRGMMLPLVLLAVVLVSTFAYYFHNYRMMQVKMSSTIGNFYNALNVAEAGVSAAITEMATQFNWKTHQTSGTAGNTTFTAPVDHQNSITSGGILHSVSGTNGTYYGKIGDYGEFKVRVGLEKIAGDNPNTKTVNYQVINESPPYLISDKSKKNFTIHKTSTGFNSKTWTLPVLTVKLKPFVTP
jgi:Tfp pilus assembly protein PilX